MQIPEITHVIFSFNSCFYYYIVQMVNTESTQESSVVAKRFDDCLPCRLISGFGVIGIGLYLSHQGRKQTGKFSKYALLGLATGKIALFFLILKPVLKFFFLILQFLWELVQQDCLIFCRVKSKVINRREVIYRNSNGKQRGK